MKVHELYPFNEQTRAENRKLKELYEGLISSASPWMVINYFTSSFPTAKITHQREPGNNTVVILVNVYAGDKQTLRNVIKRADVLGWFPSTYADLDEGWFVKYHPVKIFEAYDQSSKGLVIRFEAKYDVKAMTPERLYHATPSIYADKILKIGLVPRSHSKLTTHPERIYLADNQRNLIEVLIPHMAERAEYEEWAIFEVRLRGASPVIRLFHDPLYPHGYYTLQNIGPEHLRLLGELTV